MLHRTAQGNAPSPALSQADLACWLNAGLESGPQSGLQPPEFRFCVDSGAPLRRPATAAPGAPWVPPFGASPLAPRAARVVGGLRQSNSSIVLSRRNERRPEAEPDASQPLPPPGDYEFFSVAAGTRTPALLALDPSKGTLYAWLPASQRWEPLEHDGGGLLAVSRLARAAWRCELSQAGSSSLLFLPTEEGLACIQPDAVGLSFQAQYHGQDAAVGAPVQFGEQVWAPLRSKAGMLRFVSASLQGRPGAVVELPDGPLETGALQAPLADGRLAIWPAAAGQLVLRKQASGAIQGSFLAWPQGLQPAFEFGSPFLSRDGSLWQLCFDTRADSYVYLQLGVEQPERETTTAPRLCTGSFNFRFASRFRSAPWLEPEHGDDSATNAVVLPLLESSPSAAVLGVKLATTEGLAHVLQSSERMRVELVLDDDTTQTAFYCLSVAEPWRLRFFVHEARLWAYHPLSNRLDGWNLQ
ncbi:hypothetical protein EV684_101225 [Rubrivivax gelatinosus]|uniref:Uncharacterized protein n=1 Tax=Rubrivivax gelatinosus TaxID=28068 RepID=A0A4R2MXP5_RUBGE|nr:hypothetical protein EV684_101225 [Rubrivivax gelatinosus]